MLNKVEHRDTWPLIPVERGLIQFYSPKSSSAATDWKKCGLKISSICKWQFGLMVSCFTLGPVSTWMGDCVMFNSRSRKLSRFNQPPRSTQPGRPSVGRRNEYRQLSSGHHKGRNGEFCVTVGPVSRTVGILACRLKALAVNIIRPTWVVCWINLGLTLAGSSQKCRKCDELPSNRRSSITTSQFDNFLTWFQYFRKKCEEYAYIIYVRVKLWN